MSDDQAKPPRPGVPLGRLQPVSRPGVSATGGITEAGSERRVEPRAAIRVPLKVSIPSVDFPFESEAINISQSGVFIAMNELPPMGTMVDIEISLDSGSLLLHATGEVVRREERRVPRGVGVRFIDVSYEAQALIDRMVADERLFGRYRIEALIGQGGMAEVYAARALEGPHAGETVAVKRILPALARDPETLALFQREAEVTRLLRHPAIVEVLDVGSVGDTLYIAMEYVNGCNLAQILDACIFSGRHLPVELALYIAAIVAEALDYAHNARAPDGTPLGIVHRDVSPGNVFISDLGVIKLGDFGVVHLGTAPDDAIVGKEPYMAPEIIAKGKALPASDVFSLGAVLFELLTNRIAFDGEDGREIWKKITKGAAVAPSTLRQAIPPAVDALVLRTLAPKIAGVSGGVVGRVKDLFGPPPVERFATAAELAAALGPLFDPAIGNEAIVATAVRGLIGQRRRPVTGPVEGSG